MSTARITLAAIALALLGLGLAADARAADPATHIVPGVATDPAIDPGRRDSYVWLTGDPNRRVGKLLVFMPGGAANNFPADWQEIGSEAGRLGYHAIGLTYQNDVPVANPAACGNAAEPPAAPPDCALNARLEILRGRGESPVINVSRANSIENRLTKLLQYLAANHPDEGWAQYLDTSGAEPQPRWSEVVVSGQSLGAGQAVLIASLHLVHRVATFGGWVDAKHGWVMLGATPASRFRSLIHLRDNWFPRTCFSYVPLELATSCPLTGFTLVDDTQPPFATRRLVFNLEPASLVGVNDVFHTSASRDGWIARETPGGPPAQKLLNAWRFAFGDSDADQFLDEVDNCALVANADQTDTDRDGPGDACDPLQRERLGEVRDALAARAPLADPKANAALTAALHGLDRATEAINWDDGARPDQANGRTVYDALVYTVGNLQAIHAAWADDAVATIVSLAEEITRLALDEATAGPERDEAEAEKARGDRAGYPIGALKQYRKAWALVREP